MTHIHGFGAERIAPPAGASPEELEQRNRQMLSRALNLGTLVAFCGSGCSAPLGYPNWKEFTRRAVDATLAAISELPSSAGDENIHRLREIAEQIVTDKKADTRRYLFYLGFCQRVAWTLPDKGADFYSSFIAHNFGYRNEPQALLNPYHALLDLPIYRFVTTNYDVELERALKDRRRVPFEEFGIDVRHNRADNQRRSFTQTPEFYDQIAGFAIPGVPGMNNTVFHCHGRYDDIRSIVATEDDYQRWYLDGEEASIGAFRESIQLLFGSNPILFVGYGMGDEDLLRPLRMFSAAGRDEKYSRPLFALIPRDPKEKDQHDFLFERYGVHVIPFDPPLIKDRASDSAPAWAYRLKRELEGIRNDWQAHLREWRKKPPIRSVRVGPKPPDPYQHYAPTMPKDDLAPERLDRDLASLTTLLKENNVRVVVITGSGGAGKSWRAMKLLQWRAKTRHGKTGTFFWSSYYTDDWLTGIDRALSYLEEEPKPRHRRIERFAECLKKKHLLVFDGFERLLAASKEPGIGIAQHRGVRALLEIAMQGKAKIVITSRLMPDVLKRYLDKKDPRVREFEVRKITAADLESGNLFGKVDGDEFLRRAVSSVCSLCDGHSYALVLAAAYARLTSQKPRGANLKLPKLTLRPYEPSEISLQRLDELQQGLANVSPTHRLWEVIDLMVKDVDHACHGVARPLLERIAIFMTPVTHRALDICYEEATAGRAKEGLPKLQETLDVLHGARLIFPVSTEPVTPGDPAAYTVHPTVRGYVFSRLHQAGSDAMPSFVLAGYTSGNAAVAPGSHEAGKQVTSLFKKLIDAAEKAGSNDIGRELCRSAFGVLRSRFEANTVTSWTTFKDYIRYGVSMAMVAKSVTPEASRWSYFDRTDMAQFVSDHGALYADELAWLYSDVGLALYAEGNMADTYAVWELSYEIDRVTDNEEESGQYIVQARLHMAGVFLELGRLTTASEYLTLCERANEKYGDSDYRARVQGYRALLQHLRADFAGAERLYSEAIDTFTEDRNLRALSIFSRHRAALQMSEQQHDLAFRLARTSRSAAEEGQHADLVGYARSMTGHLHRLARAYTESQHEYEAALAIARKYKIKRLECEVLCEMGRLTYELGDWQTARARATASLMLANELSLGLRQTQGLLVLGLATIRAGDPRLGAAYLRHVHRLAQKQHYLLRAREAERELRNLGLAPPDGLEHYVSSQA